MIAFLLFLEDHFYTSNEEERKNAINHLGYTDEGQLGYCVIPAAHPTNPTNEDPKKDCCGAKKALYRFYNQSAKGNISIVQQMCANFL